MNRLTVTRWTRYGKDRLYVVDEAGRRVGWLDLQTGSCTLDRMDLVEAFHEAVASAQPSCPAARPPVDTPTASDDLAERRPGQAAREQAQRELAALEERGRVRAWVTRALDVKTDERAWRIGADGEKTIGGRLERLVGKGWHVLHAVPVGNRGSDIDHVLVGPGGVYTINTKNRPGASIWVGRHAIKVNGRSEPYLRNSRFEAQRAARLLSHALGWEVPVKPVLVLLTGTVVPDVRVVQQPEDVVVLTRSDVPRVFARAPQRLSAEQVDRVFEQARRSSTWCVRSRGLPY